MLLGKMLASENQDLSTVKVTQQVANLPAIETRARYDRLRILGLHPDFLQRKLIPSRKNAVSMPRVSLPRPTAIP